MSPRDVDIADMQCWIFCLADRKWNIGSKRCSEIFKHYKLLEYLRDDYDYLHLSSYDCALEDLEAYLNRRGVDIYAAA